ncbi:MAG: hypothetical protein JOY62_15250 [Acidobacteriaceae bacterium]|nr:hypothetical protein [Acidobacteriaceae bacterium]MBV9781319.1 hypothetical protein [Acidobacteriaceae bacterium]
MRFAALLFSLGALAVADPQFQIQFSSSARSTPADGRLIVIVSKQLDGEPRFQVEWGIETQQIFATDVDQWKPGELTRMDAAAIGSPLRSLRDLPPGTYNIQAVLNVYDTVHRADGHTLKLHMDHGEGQQWDRSPGNIYSKPQRAEIGRDSVIRIELTDVIPPITPPEDTKFLRHVRIESKLLTKFWGTPIHLSATVLVPDDFDQHPDQHYPIAFLQGHFDEGRNMLRESPPPPGMKDRERRNAQFGYRLYQAWTTGELPKMLIVITQHPTPYYDDSYGVNTANMGPYGDALTQDLYPYIEQKFRAIGQPWARVLFGGSTGGWMTLAQQIFYPDYFGGAWGFCPDPVDFHVFQLVNVYEDKNAYFDEGPFERLPKLVGRLPDDHILATMQGMSRQEAALGIKGRSGGQFDAFHATFGPTDAEGYPAKLWNAETGAIDPAIAKYWEQHYDLTALLQRDWPRLGPKLVGKLHVTAGTKDTFYLDAAAHRMQDFLESTKLPGKGPYYGGSFDFGIDKPHCYIGEIPEGQSIFTHYLPIFAEHMKNMAPPGADIKSWMP